MPAPPSYQKVNPGDQPVIFLVAAVGDAAAVDGRRVRRVDDRAAHLDGQRRRAGAASSAPRSTPCASTSIRASWRRTASASTKWRRRSQNANVNLPTGTMYGADKTFTCRPTASCCAAAAYGPIDHRLPQRQPGAARRGRARLRRRRERQDRRPGISGERDDLPRRSRSSRAPTSSQVVDAVKALLPTFREQLPAVGVARRPHRSLGRDPRVGARREAHAAADRRAGRAGDLPVPAEHLGDDHPEPRAAGVDRRRPSR